MIWGTAMHRDMVLLVCAIPLLLAAAFTTGWHELVMGSAGILFLVAGIVGGLKRVRNDR